jgi:hypothetical protein
MIECRHCREVFRQPVETVGARCPTCRMPLFEKDRHRQPVVDLGPCAVHASNSAAAKCQRCGKMMCVLCRTRWDEDFLCSQCLDQLLLEGQSSPRLAHAQSRQAKLSVVFAFMGWGVLVLAMWPLASLFRGNPDKSPASFALVLFFASFFFAMFAVGQGAACIRTRGRRMVVATVGVALAGIHLGIGLGLMVLNII